MAKDQQQRKLRTPRARGLNTLVRGLETQAPSQLASSQEEGGGNSSARRPAAVFPLPHRAASNARPPTPTSANYNITGPHEDQPQPQPQPRTHDTEVTAEKAGKQRVGLMDVLMGYHHLLQTASPSSFSARSPHPQLFPTVGFATRT